MSELAHVEEVDAELKVRRIFMPLFADDAPRFSVVVAHRRSGKTVAALQRLIHGALTCHKPNGQYAFIAPFRMQAKNVAWKYIKRMTAGFPNTQANESELWVELFNGSRIQLYGSDNPDALRGAYLDGAALDELAQQDPATWDQVVRPMLSDRKGWALFIGTPQGRNSFAKLYDQATGDGWGRWFWPAEATGLIDPEELAAAKRDMSPEAYAQEYELSWSAAIKGSFYGSMMEQADKEGRICDLPVNPAAWTMTAWDLGVRDATAIWIIQQDGPWFHAIDYIESSGVGLDYYVGVLKDKGYRYDQHLAPADIAVVELGTGRSRRDVAADLGVRFDTCAQHRVMDGISAVRDLLPKIRFDATKCARGIECLLTYRQDWNEKLGALSANPVHDWSSHGCLAAGTMVKTDLGDVPIEDMRAGYRVWTPVGYKPVSWAGETMRVDELVEITLADGTVLRCTPNHKVLTARGWILSDTMRYYDTVSTGKDWKCRLLAFASKVTHTNFRALTTAAMSGGALGLLACIGQSMKTRMGQSLKAMKSTISTSIRSITSWIICAPCLQANTSGCTLCAKSLTVHYRQLGNWQDKEPPSGTPAQKGLLGIQSKASGHGTIARLSRVFATSAAILFRPLSLLGRSFAGIIARRGLGASSTLTRTQNTHVVCVIRTKHSNLPVYDLTVPGAGVYLANGVLVSNSDALRYFAMGRHGSIADEWQGRSPNLPNRYRESPNGYVRAVR